MSKLPPHLQTQLNRELDLGEKTNWVSQPVYSVLKKVAMTNWLGIGVVVGLFDIFFAFMWWIATITPKSDRQDEPWTFLLIAGVLMVLWICSLPLFQRWTKKLSNNTIYAITDRRVIILVVHGDKTVTERDYRGDELVHLARKENPDGTGTLTFESARGAGASSGTASRHRFQAIEDVIEVERMLRKQFGDA